ncbi:MAG: hypothetical protein U5R46_04395 [Gammaproteobacteria bacterium]|nr:hypothetical protein [Gammaproteobacteria bacterium]
MPKDLIHIGYHKSATTWFQKVYYPGVRNARYIDRNLVKRAFLEPSALHWRPDDARDLLNLDPDNPVILCEEELSGYLHNGGLFGCLSKDMAYRLRAVFPEANIVAFIRRQPDMLAACYAQYIRGGGTFSVRRYLWPQRYLVGAESRYYKIPRFSFDHFEYLPLMRHYVELFGRERVHVFPYEALAHGPEVFLQEFSQRLGLERAVDGPGSRRRNVSYQPWLIPVARLLNLMTRRTVQDKHYLVHIPYWYSARRWFLEMVNRLPLSASSSPAGLLGAGTVARINDRYRETNCQLAREFDMPLESYGYPL